MTGYYEYGYMPAKLSMSCLQCGQKATFYEMQMIKIRLKTDIPFFQKHRHFAYFKVKKSSGHIEHCAGFYPHLSIQSLENIKDLPESYISTQWSQSQFDSGCMVCHFCNTRQVIELKWPTYAYYKVMYKDHLLWAYDYTHLNLIYDYLRLKQRPSRDALGLRYLPKIFLTQHARAELCKKIEKYLNKDAS